MEGFVDVADVAAPISCDYYRFVLPLSACCLNDGTSYR
jgi:hypothetical protein